MRDNRDLPGPERICLPYLEGHPRIQATEAAKALARGYSQCVWRWNDGKRFRRCDVALTQDNNAATLILKGDAPPDPSYINLSGAIGITHASNYSTDRAFSMFICNRCLDTAKVLVHTYDCLCRSCSGLLYRSQRTGSLVNKWERLDQLTTLVGFGRPKGMHHKSYAALTEELATLRAQLGDVHAHAPQEYLLRLESTWMKPAGDTGD